MQRSETTIAVGVDDEVSPVHQRNRFRLVPPAITPVRVSDVGAGVVGQLRGTGRDEFRRTITDYLDAEGAATYTSFRRTLAGCFHALAERGDETDRTVLLPAFCSSDFPDAIEGVGLEPIQYDVDSDSLAVDLQDLRQKLDDAVLAVVTISVLGYGSPMAEIADLCTDANVALVEALGYALGTTYRDQPLGTFGDCAVLNFQQGKPIPVGGGMLITQNPALNVGDSGRPSVEPNVGALLGYAALSRPGPYYAYSQLQDRFEGVVDRFDRVTTHPESKFDVEYAPPFATMSNFQGTIGKRIFDRLPSHRREREQTARYYTTALSDVPEIETLTPIDGLSNLQHVRFPVLFDTEPLRDRIKNALNRAGIQATTLYDWPILDPGTFPGAGTLQRRILTLPTHPYVQERDRRLAVETICNEVRRSR